MRPHWDVGVDVSNEVAMGGWKRGLPTRSGPHGPVAADEDIRLVLGPEHLNLHTVQLQLVRAHPRSTIVSTVKGRGHEADYNAMTNNQSKLRNGKANELQTRNTDGVRRSAWPTCAVTSQVKGQGYNVTLSVSLIKSFKKSRDNWYVKRR